MTCFTAIRDESAQSECWKYILTTKQNLFPWQIDLWRTRESRVCCKNLISLREAIKIIQFPDQISFQRRICYSNLLLISDNVTPFFPMESRAFPIKQCFAQFSISSQDATVRLSTLEMDAKGNWCCFQGNESNWKEERRSREGKVNAKPDGKLFISILRARSFCYFKPNFSARKFNALSLELLKYSLSIWHYVNIFSLCCRSKALQ